MENAARFFAVAFMGLFGGGPGFEKSLAGAFGRGPNCFGWAIWCGLRFSKSLTGVLGEGPNFWNVLAGLFGGGPGFEKSLAGAFGRGPNGFGWAIWWGLRFWKFFDWCVGWGPKFFKCLGWALWGWPRFLKILGWAIGGEPRFFEKFVLLGDVVLNSKWIFWLLMGLPPTQYIYIYICIMPICFWRPHTQTMETRQGPPFHDICVYFVCGAFHEIQTENRKFAVLFDIVPLR